MAHEDNGAELETYQPSSGLAVAVDDPAKNPGLPPHRERMTDKDPKAEKTAERTVYSLFYLSLAGSIWAIAAYMLFPIESGRMIDIRNNNMFIGLGIALALLAIGIGAIHWSKALMVDHEVTEMRHPTRGSDATRAGAVKAFSDANDDSGFGRRTVIRNSLIAAIAASILPGITLFRGMAPHTNPSDPHAGDPVYKLNHTLWKEGMRLASDPDGVAIKASDLTLGSAVHVIPEELASLGHADGYLEEKAKAIVLLVKVRPEQIKKTGTEKDNWSPEGIMAFSKVCTHVGCPVALYEQQTHHLLCPCHQSQFDILDHAAVIFGPAARPLPQLPIHIDDDGYLVASSDFTEPVGPSFWERR